MSLSPARSPKAGPSRIVKLDLVSPPVAPVSPPPSTRTLAPPGAPAKQLEEELPSSLPTSWAAIAHGDMLTVEVEHALYRRTPAHAERLSARGSSGADFSVQRLARGKGLSNTPTVMTDDELLVTWRGGDQQAGRELFERHYDAIDRFFRNKVGEDAEDLAQKTFLGCLEKVEGDRYTEHGSFRSWLFAIAYRQLCKHYRNSNRDRARFDFNSVSAHDLDPTPSSAMVRSEEERLLLGALRQIPVDMQVALELRYWEELSDIEIAQTLDAPLGTIKSRLRRGRAILAERMEALSSSPEQLQSTLGNFDGWARGLRELAFGS